MLIVIYPLVFFLHLLATSYFYITKTFDTPYNYLYNITQTILIILPTLTSLRYQHRYPQLRPLLTPLIVSNIFFISAFYLWFYYNIKGIPTPFPSLADIFFLLFYPANIWALIRLNKLTENHWTISNWLTFFGLFITLAFLSLGFLFTQAINLRDPLLMIGLNILYPLLDCFIAALGLTILRSQTHLGYRFLFFYVFGYLFIGLSDTIFSYQTNLNTYWNGSLVDLLFVFSYTLIGLGTHFLPTLFDPNATVELDSGQST